MIDASQYIAHKSPGKFEGETPATEYYYSVMLDGNGEAIYAGEEDCETTADLFQVDADEADAFGLPIGHWFLLREDAQGFALGSVHATREEAESHFHAWAQ